MNGSQRSKRCWIRRFAVESPTKSDKGYIVYKVTSLLFPEGFPEAATKIVCYKRYSDFIKLHLELKKIHSNLYLKGKFPSLPKASYFNRFDEKVLEERREKCLSFLEYSGTVPLLYNSQAFALFMNGPLSPECKESGDDNSFTLISDLEEQNRLMDASAISTSMCTSELPTPLTPGIDKSPDLLAEEDITLARNFEKENDLESSISHYKSAIGTLLKIVNDTPESNSKALKKKIAALIDKTESLIHDREMSIQGTSHYQLYGDLRDLKRYKIVKVLSEKNILVRDTQSPQYDLVVIKTLQKSGATNQKKSSLLPITIPYMVQFIRYYESDDLIHIVLEYIPQGKLYDVCRNIFCPKPYSSGCESFPSLASWTEMEDTLDIESDHSVDITKVEVTDSGGLICIDKYGIETLRKEDDGVQEFSDISDLTQIIPDPIFINKSSFAFLEAFPSKPTNLKISDIIPNLPVDFERLPIDLIRRWASQLVYVLFGLHFRRIYVQDLNPNNLLMDSNGNLKLTYQCEWNSVNRTLNTMAKAHHFVAPEVSYCDQVTPAADFWSVGIILFELVSGIRFVDAYPSGLLSHTPLQFPNPTCHFIDPHLKEIISSFLQPVLPNRLGYGSNGQSDIQSHSFFKDVKWNKLS